MLRSLLVVVVLGLVVQSVAPSARAQDVDAPLSAAARLLVPEARARLATNDTTLSFRTQPVPNGRYDVDAGVLRAAYRIEGGLAVPFAAPDAAARAYLKAEAARFGWRPEADDLVLASVVEGAYSSHVVFRQTFFGLPVFQRQVKVNLDRRGRPTMVLSGYAPHLRAVRQFDPNPSLSAAAAAERARRLVTETGVETTAPELVVYPSDEPRLAWHLVATPASGVASWDVLLDARTGELIHLVDVSAHAGEVRSVTSKGRAAAAGTPARVQIPSTFETRYSTFAQGSGLVFDPDPITTAGVTYGGAYVDGGDSDVAEINAQRKDVVLHDLTQGADGLYRLEGPYVRIVGNIGLPYTPPAEPDPNGFRYPRSNPFFEAVMVYHHVDKSQRYLQTLDVGRPILERPVHANPHAFGTNDRSGSDDNSQYTNGSLYFGGGGIDDAEDGGVIWHEYAHALLDDGAPGLLSTFEGQALHEGWADYWSASYTRSLIESGAVPARDWHDLFPWDGNNPLVSWCGRRLDHPGHYPDDVAYTLAKEGCGVGGKYAQGVLWATTLMDIYPVVGRTVLDRLNLASHAYLQSPATFRDAAEAIIQADFDLYGGDHAGVLVDVFGARGYVDPALYGPVAAHTALPATEDLGGTVDVFVDAASAAAAVDSVLVFYRYGTAPLQRLALDAQGGDRYAGRLPLPSAPGIVSYYVEVLDARGLRSRLPAGAPVATFQFQAGPDAVPPTIEHVPMENVSVAGWPFEINATVRDNLGVDSVWAEYRVAGPDGGVTAEGTFGLVAVASGYHGTFPIEAVAEGSVVEYRLVARDRAAARNQAALPADGLFAVGVVAEGVLRAFTFEGQDHGVEATGAWNRGAPTYALRVAHSGTQVWATGTDRAYPEAAQRSSLTLPPFNLQGAGDTAYLVFWHWYDFEHSGRVEPGATNPQAVLWDGANVKVSTDGGRTWSVLAVEGGYDGTVYANLLAPAAERNPLGGEPGFGGFSYGWRRVVARLPAAADVRVRFDLGTDEGNRSDVLRGYAGWYLDDVSVTTQRPTDGAPPEATLLPPATLRRPAGLYGPTLTVGADDDTGVEAVHVEYEIRTAAGATQEGLVRLAMSEADRTLFQGTIPSAVKFAVGDRISYYVLVRDFDGNEAHYPAAGPPFEVEYLTMRAADALANVRAAGQWQQAGDGWQLAPGAAASSLVLEPYDLPANGDEVLFVLDHAYTLQSGAGAAVSLSADDGATWTRLAPREGYPATDGAGAGVFGGAADHLSTFDLTPYAGRQVRLRLDFTGRALQDGEAWTVRHASYSLSTREADFVTPRVLALHANFPDPFATTTTISYTVPDDMTPVRLAVFDMLGRRVAVLVHREEAAGTYTLTFDGSRLAAGIYFVRLETSGRQLVEKMMIAR